VVRAPVLDVYARLSKAHDGETVQVELCTEKIAARGGAVGEVFKDNSLSAWNPKVIRPQWDALMARLESRCLRRGDGVRPDPVLPQDPWTSGVKAGEFDDLARPV
jgi:hypothetical protein